MRYKYLAVLLTCLASSHPAAANTNDIAALVRNGLFEEEANHHIDAAMDYYQQAIGKLDQDRVLVATALYHLGECYRLQGKTNEANVQYQRLVREFPDQKQLVEMSRAHLPATNATGAAASAQTSVATELTRISESPTEQTQIQRIKNMIQNSPDLINSSVNGEPPLIAAVRSGSIAAAKLLIDNGAAVEPESDYQLPLNVAISLGEKTMVEFLLSKGANPNALDRSRGWPGLYAAADMGARSIAETLLAHGADVNQKNTQGDCPLHAAASRNFKGMAELLLSHHADVNVPGNDGEPPLFRAVEYNHLEMARLLVSNGANVNFPGKSGQTPLLVTMRFPQNLDMFKLLLDSGANVNARAGGLDALDIAINGKQAGMVKALLEKKADPNAEGAWNGQSTVTPLIRAVFKAEESGKSDMAALLLQFGADPNLKDAQGETPLTRAVGNGNTNLMRELISHHADVNETDGQGNPPLTWARRETVKKILFDAGANEDYLRSGGIFVTQKGSGAIGTKVYSKSGNSIDQHKLYELMSMVYSEGGSWGAVAFPDLARLTINRLGAKGGRQEIEFDLTAALKTGDCSTDPVLEWGDVVMIPQQDHKIDMGWGGLSREVRNALAKCLLRKVQIVVKGQTTTLGLLPSIIRSYSGSSGRDGGGWWTTTDSEDDPDSFAAPLHADKVLLTFDLNQVVHQANVLLISSDMTRVKVTRRNPAAGGTPLVIICNLESSSAQPGSPYFSGSVIINPVSPMPDSANDIQLMDGDVVEIPERAEGSAQK
jgi:ankyrin repeat protein